VFEVHNRAGGFGTILLLPTVHVGEQKARARRPAAAPAGVQHVQSDTQDHRHKTSNMHIVRGQLSDQLGVQQYTTAAHASNVRTPHQAGVVRLSKRKARLKKVVECPVKNERHRLYRTDRLLC
jgi:hypothetical protein